MRDQANRSRSPWNDEAAFRMAYLIAEGPHPEDGWRRLLPADECVVLGRDAGVWSVPWDRFISSEHADLVWRGGQLSVQKLAKARNPIYVRGQTPARFCLKPGEHFVIGETTFRLVEDAESTPRLEQAVLQTRAISAQELQQIQFRDAPHRLDVLKHLPDVIAEVTDDSALFVAVVNMLMAGISQADAIALVIVEPGPEGESTVRTLHVEHRRASAGDFRPSHRLVREAVRRQQTILYTWEGGLPLPAASPDYTQAAGVAWAFSTPVRTEACQGWAFYAAGNLSGDARATLQAPWEVHELGDDLKFSELVASILGSLRQVQLLQRRQTSLSPFFTPAVISKLSESDPDEALRPRETDVSVLFCDLRGFSRRSERLAGDLLDLLQRISEALRLMTQNIVDWGGVIGDYHGDAAMGFWGWPNKQPDMVQRACMAALGIRTLYEAIGRWKEHPLAGMRVGIGLATGRAVAGKIGTVDQVKITVMGPIVNLASRLESMTKILHAPILMDETTAQRASALIAPRLARQRRVARVKPYGLDTPLMVSELLPPLLEDDTLRDEHLTGYEAALDAFLDGQWDKAYQMFYQLPPEDRVKDFLGMLIAKNDRTPPRNWDGVIDLEWKS